MKMGKIVRSSLLALVAGFSSLPVLAGQIDLASIKLPWKNAATQGAMLDLGQKPNTVFVFEVFSIGCHWCNVNAPLVQEMAQTFVGNERVQFIDLGLDTREIDYTRWISAHKPSYPVVQDQNRKIFDTFKKSNGIPQTFVVDCQGNLVGSTIGSWDDASKDLIKASIDKAEETVCNN